MNRNLILISSLLLLQFPSIPIKATSLSQNSKCKIEREGKNEFYSTKELQTLANKITVKIISDNNLGSGTLIGKNGNNYLVLTNDHVIQGVNSIKLQTADGKTYSAEIKNNFSESDLAVLEFQSDQNYCLPEISKTTPDIDTRILAAGFSDSAGNIAFSEGEVKKTSNLKEGYEIGYSSNIEQGMSGGAILDSMGELVGINGRSAYPILNSGYVYQNGKSPSQAEIREMRKLSWGIPISTALAQVNRDVLTAYKLPFPKDGIVIPQPVLAGWLAELEEKAKQFTVRIDSSSNANGSGIIIAKEGDTYTVLTAAHVVPERNQYSYEILTHDGKKYPVEKSTIDTKEGVDLGILKFKSQQDYKVATLANYFPNRDDYMFTAGYPKLNDSSSPWRFTIGRISDLLQTRQFESKSNSDGKLQTTSSIAKGYELVYTSITYGGMSGGAVLDYKGRVIGIHGASEIEQTTDNCDINSGCIVQLGYSLGIPISTFLGQKFDVKAQVEENTTSPQLKEQEVKSIEEAVLSANISTGNTEASQWLERGNQLWRLRRYKEAVEAFHQAIKQEPTFVYLAYYGKALALGGDEKYKEAVAALQKAVELKKDKNFVAAFSYLSVIYRHLEQPEKALIEIEKAIQLQPENPNLYNEKYAVLTDLKRYKEAETAINKAIKLAPRADFYNNRGTVYYDQKKWELALDDYNKAIQINPNYALAYNNRGFLYKEQKKWNLALVDYNKGIQINPKDALVYNNRGILYYEQKKWNLALDDYNKAIQIDSKYAIAYNNRGLIYKKQKKWDLALTDFNKAIQINTKYALAYINRGNLYGIKGKWN
ncbi:MAG: trypsin-like peptidase domain-containing protein [Rivularia sp. (in: cyanobacteria)]